MASSVNFVVAFFVLAFVLQNAEAQCSKSNIIIHQQRTGKLVQGKPEFKVVVNNNCICSHGNVVLSCKGFCSVEAVDPSIFKMADGGNCLLNNGELIHYDTVIEFTYAQDAQIDFKVVSSQIACS